MPFNLTRSRTVARASCIRGFTGTTYIPSYVFDATTLVADGNGYFTVPIGSFLTLSPADPTKVKIYAALGSNVNAVQTVTITGTPTGGTFTLSYGGVTSAGIAYNANAAAVQAALVAMSSIGAGNVVVGGGALPGSAVTVTFQGALAAQPIALMTASGAGLTGGASPAVTPTTTTPGQTAEAIIGVYDGPTNKDFWSNAIAADEPVPVYQSFCAFDISKLQNWAAFGATARAALPTCTFS